MSNENEIVAALYRAFNARDIDAALIRMRPDVTWANGMEGGIVCGHAGVRNYWINQWRLIDPRVEPKHFDVEGNRVIVDVHQIVRDLNGFVKNDRIVKHIFTLDGGLISKFEIG